MDRHLVAVEVRVERGADERMEPDGLAFDEHRIKGLNAEPVQRGGAVQEHRMLLDHLFEHVPHLGTLALDHFLCALDGRGIALLFKLVEDERLEQLQRHLLRKTALMELEVRTDDDDGTAGIVDAFSEQVLPEPSLLALQHIGKGLERTLVRTAQHPAPAAVIEERIHSLLQHAFLVPDDDRRRLQLFKPVQPVVPVDDPAVQIVQVGGREPAAFERNERAQLRRNDRDHIQDHPLGLVARLAERLDHFEPLGQFLLGGHGGGRLDLLADLLGLDFEIDGLEHLPDRFRAHAGLECAGAELQLRLAELFFRQELFLLERRVSAVDHDIVLEIEHLLELTKRHVEQRADAARQALQEPDMGDRRGELDMAHALAPHLGLDHFDAALVADDAAVFHALVLAAETFPVLDRTEYLCAEQTVPLRLEGPVVDGLRLFHLAEGPFLDPLRRGDLYPHGVKADVLGLVEQAHDIGPGLVFCYPFIFHCEPPLRPIKGLSGKRSAKGCSPALTPHALRLFIFYRADEIFSSPITRSFSFLRSISSTSRHRLWSSLMST